MKIVLVSSLYCTGAADVLEPRAISPLTIAPMCGVLLAGP